MSSGKHAKARVARAKRAQAKRARARRAQLKRTEQIGRIAFAAGLGFAVATGGQGIAAATVDDGQSADTSNDGVSTAGTGGGETDSGTTTTTTTTTDPTETESDPDTQTTTTATGSGPSTSTSSSGGALTSSGYDDAEGDVESEDESEVSTEAEAPPTTEPATPPTVEVETPSATTDPAADDQSDTGETPPVDDAKTVETGDEGSTGEVDALTVTSDNDGAEQADENSAPVESTFAARSMAFAAPSNVTEIGTPLPPLPISGPTETALKSVLVYFVALQSALSSGSPLSIPLYFMLTSAFGKLMTAAHNDLPVYTNAQGQPADTVDVTTLGAIPAVGSLQASILTGGVGASDPNGDPLTYSVPTGPSRGQVAIDVNLGTYTYIATDAALIRDGGTDSFVVRLDDSRGAASHFNAPNGHTTDVTVTVHVTGTGINLGPTIDSNEITPPVNTETGVVTGKVVATDPEGDHITYSGSAVWGDVDVDEDGVWTYTPSEEARHNASIPLIGITEDLVTITATDGHVLLPATSSVLVPITSYNTPPSAGAVNVATNGTAFNLLTGKWIQTTTGTLQGADSENDTVIYTVGTYDTDKGGTVVVGPLNVFTYVSAGNAGHAAAAPNASDADKVDTFTVPATDGHGGNADIVLSVSLVPVNSQPTVDLSQPAKNTDSIGVVRGQVGISDADNDTLTYTLVNALNSPGATANSTTTSKGAIVQLNADGSYTYIPKYSSTGAYNDTFYVTATDGHGASATATVNILSTNLSIGKSVLTSGTNTETGKLSLPAGDVGLLSYTLGTPAGQGNAVVNPDGTYSYTRTTLIRQDSFTVIGTDVNGRQVTAAVVSVSPPMTNNAPVVSYANTTSNLLALVQTTTGQLSATDANGDTVAYTSGVLPVVVTSTNGALVTINPNGSYSYVMTALNLSYYHNAAKTTATDSQVNDYFVATVTDGFGGNTPITVKVPVYATNSDPSLTDGVRTGNSWLGIVKSDADLLDTVNGPTITKQPQHGSASFSSLLGNLTTSGTQAGDTIEMTVTNPDYWKVVNGVPQVGTLASFTKVYTV